MPTPAWLVGKDLNKTFLIANTTGMGGAHVVAWGGFATDLALNRMWLAASGGHNDSSDNRFVELDLNADTPAWELLIAPTAAPVATNPDFTYGPDGKGNSSHIYDYAHWVPSVGRVLKAGLRGLWNKGHDGYVTQGLNPDSVPPAWDAAGTWAFNPSYGWAAAVDHINSKIFVTGLRIFDPVTGTYSTGASGSQPMRYPVAYDTLRNQFFGLMWASGEQEGNINSALNASVVAGSGTGVQTVITFNASDAYTQFVSEKLAPGTSESVGYCGMCYDSANDCFYWYNGLAGRENTLYKIIPNGTSVWDMELFAFAPGSTSLPVAPIAGINGRIKYFPLLKGFVISPSGVGIYFVPTSPVNITTFTLESATTQADAPFSIGQVFKKGDVPTGSQLISNVADFQVVSKNVWSDGSLKFAIISGSTPLTGGVPLTVEVFIGTPEGGTALTTTNLKNTGCTASIGAGAFGTVSWATTDWDSPFQTWVSGPKMSSWIYRKQIGSDAHLVGFLEVRLWSGGEVEILPWIENGYFEVASPTNKLETYTFTLTTQRYSGSLDIKHHTRTVLINGTMLSYWLGADPGVTPRHNVTYMQQTELVPTYSASLPALAYLVTTFAPFQSGNITYDSDNMQETGYQRPIGLLPEYDVAYLVCTTNNSLLYGSCLRNGYSVGRYPIHYRDATSNRVPQFSLHQTKVLSSGSGVAHTGSSSTNNYTPTTTGAGLGWDTAHCPAVGVMPYLITGHWYHMETVQFAAILNYFNINDRNIRTTPVSTFRFLSDYGSVQTRSAAWGFRSLAHALALTPDADTTLRNEFKTLAETAITYYHDTFVAQTNNQFGIIEPGELYGTVGGNHMGSPWQQDFFTAAYGYALAMEIPVSAAITTKLSTFFAWKAKSVIGRLGTSADWWYINATPYTMAFGVGDLPDFQTGTGPWMASWNAAYNASTATWWGSTEGTLTGEFTSDNWGKSMWGNLHPAIAYAVRHSVPGALDGYNRMIAASNYDDIQATFNISPVWSVAPAVIASEGSTGTVARTNANDTSAAVGNTTIKGTLARTNTSDTSTASGTITVTGTIARTNANDIANASGPAGSEGTLAYTNINDTGAASGTTIVTGTLSRTNANDSVAATGGYPIGTAAIINANDSASAQGIILKGGRGGGKSHSRKGLSRSAYIPLPDEFWEEYSTALVREPLVPEEALFDLNPEDSQLDSLLAARVQVVNSIFTVRHVESFKPLLAQLRELDASIAEAKFLKSLPKS